MAVYEKRLTKEEWGRFANKDMINDMLWAIENDTVSCWTKEILRLTKEGDKCLEIGCGTGQTVGYLAVNGRKVDAVDYSKDSITLVEELFKRLNIKDSRCICQDAVNTELPFKENEFDVIYSCGLLEHFEREERVVMLKKWKRFSKTMISMVPNSASLAYHMGKNMMEEAETWEYGKELPQNSLKDEFFEAGYSDIREYSIGSEHALNFLPKKHPLRKVLLKLIKSGINLDIYHQGYLLVTLGKSC